jgi:hypothetical protein
MLLARGTCRLQVDSGNGKITPGYSRLHQVITKGYVCMNYVLCIMYEYVRSEVSCYSTVYESKESSSVWDLGYNTVMSLIGQVYCTVFGSSTKRKMIIIICECAGGRYTESILYSFVLCTDTVAAAVDDVIYCSFPPS